MLRKTILAILLLGLAAAPALADWTPPEANLAHYRAEYGDAAENYRTIRYNASGQEITEIKEALTGLGFFAQRVTDKYLRTLETAVRVFAGQLRIGGNGSEITPLMQAMLKDAENMPRAISPAIDHFQYGWEQSTSSYAPYTYQRLTRSSVLTNTQVGFTGRIDRAVRTGGDFAYSIVMEGDPDQVVYVTYAPLPRTTMFQSGDVVAVFGVTQGEGSLPHTGMETPLLTIAADRIGYAP